MKIFHTVFILSIIISLSLSGHVLAADSSEANNEFWTPGIHCPDITDSVLRLGMKDSRKDKRISDFQLFLADYYGFDKGLVESGKFDKTTQDYVIRLHKESGLKQKFINKETRAIVNARCGDAGIRPRIGDFTSSASTIRNGDSVSLDFVVQNTNYCRIMNLTEARAKGGEWEGYEGSISYEESRPEAVSVSFRVRPQKTSVYELHCSYDYPEDHSVEGTTQSMKYLTVMVR